MDPSISKWFASRKVSKNDTFYRVNRAKQLDAGSVGFTRLSAAAISDWGSHRADMNIRNDCNKLENTS